MPLQDVIQRYPFQDSSESAWETWSNFPQVINASLEVYSHSAELSESCLAAIERFAVLRYMTEQASVGLRTTLVSSCSRRKVEHWKTFHQHMMF